MSPVSPFPHEKEILKGGYEDQDGNITIMFSNFKIILITDPDKMSNFDAGFVSRKDLFCSDSTDKKKIGIIDHI